MTIKPRLYPISDRGVVLKGGEVVRLYQVLGDETISYLCQDCESWTGSILESGTWIVVADYNWFESLHDVHIMLIGKPLNDLDEPHEQMNLLEI